VQLAQEGIAIELWPRQVDQRMADEADVDSLLLIERLFEGKDRQHAIDGALHHPDAAGAPGPQLRTHVVDHRDAKLLDAPQQPEVEVGIVDHDQRVRLLLLCRRDQLTHRREGTRDDTQGFGEAGDGQPVEVRYKTAAGSAEPLATEAEYVDVWLTASECGHQGAGVQIARRLAARQHQARHSARLRLPRLTALRRVVRASGNQLTTGRDAR